MAQQTKRRAPQRLAAGLLAAMAILTMAPAAAQFRPALQVVIEKSGTARGDCGVAESPLHSVARLSLETNGVRESADSPLLLYIHPVVIPEGRMCFVNLDVSVRARETGGRIAGFSPREGWRAVLLCSVGIAGVADVDQVRQDVMNQLAQQIKLCLDQMEY